jgi:5-methylcytosine-specific restriction enzyme subunit McrC
MAAEKFTSEALSYIMPAFEFVSEEVNLNDIKHLKPNPFFKEYTEAIRLAKLILKLFGYNITNGNQESKIKIPPFWIDMSKLFELYVLGLLKKNFGQDVLFQFQANYGQPDYLLLAQQMIIDAKYKPYYDNDRFYLSESVISDIRQISGYARDEAVLSALETGTNGTQQGNIKKCLIIYPGYLAGVDEFGSKIDLAKMETISEFAEFYKLPIRLPILR